MKAQFFCTGSHPQPAVQDGENDAVQDQNPIQDVTHVHVSSCFCTHKHHQRINKPPDSIKTDQQRTGTYRRRRRRNRFGCSLRQRNDDVTEEPRLRTGSEGLSVRFEATQPHAHHISHLPFSEVPLKVFFQEALCLSLRRNSC